MDKTRKIFTAAIILLVLLAIGHYMPLSETSKPICSQSQTNQKFRIFKGQLAQYKDVLKNSSDIAIDKCGDISNTSSQLSKLYMF
jgi:hypothetical protein